VNWERMTRYYKEKGISAVHYPIHDFNPDDLMAKMFEGA
jgi:hypothetical protein